MWYYFPVLNDCIEIKKNESGMYYYELNGKYYSVPDSFELSRTKEECLIKYYKEQAFKINDAKRKHLEQAAKKEKELDVLYNRFKDVIEENPHLMII